VCFCHIVWCRRWLWNQRSLLNQGEIWRRCTLWKEFEVHAGLWKVSDFGRQVWSQSGHLICERWNLKSKWAFLDCERQNLKSKWAPKLILDFERRNPKSRTSLKPIYFKFRLSRSTTSLGTCLNSKFHFSQSITVGEDSRSVIPNCYALPPVGRHIGLEAEWLCYYNTIQANWI